MKIKLLLNQMILLGYLWLLTLNQLMEDASNQNLQLPKIKIYDKPKIAFRPIQIDVKHHLEKNPTI